MFKLGEVIYTKSDKFILDIGYVDNLFPLTVRARANTYSPKSGSYYGGVDLCHWNSSGVKLTCKRWDEISYNKSTKEICDILGIDYYIKHDNKKKAKEEKKEEEVMENSGKWYVVEFLHKISGETNLLKTKAENAKEALYNFYTYSKCEDITVKKAIEVQENVEDAVNIFEKLNKFDFKILNIFVLDNWEFSCEVEV